MNALKNTHRRYGRSFDGVDTLTSFTTPTPGATNGTADAVTVSIENATLVTEGNDLVFAVTLDKAPASTVTVQYSTVAGTATAPDDFTALTNQTLTFEPTGGLSQTVIVTTIDDTEQDSSVQETLTIVLSSPSGATLGTATGLGYIADNERLTEPTIDAVPRYPDTDSPTITWDSVSGAVSYNVWLTRRFPAVARVLTSESAVTTTAFTPSSDLDSGFYKIWVQAIDSNGIGGLWSEVATFEIRPDLGTATIASFASPPTFSWQTIPNAPGYELYIRTLDGTNTIIDNIATTSYTPTAALSQTEGSWWIRSSDAVGNRGWSVAGTFGRRSTILSPAGPQSNTSPTFSWVAAEGAGRYVLHVTNLDTSEVVIRDENLTGTTFTPSSALAAGNYRVWVKAIDGSTDLFSSGLWSFGTDFSIAAAEDSEYSNSDDNLQIVLTSLTNEPMDSESQHGVVSESSKNDWPAREQPTAKVENASVGQFAKTSETSDLDQHAEDNLEELDLLMGSDTLLAELLAR